MCVIIWSHTYFFTSYSVSLNIKRVVHLCFRRLKCLYTCLSLEVASPNIIFLVTYQILYF